MTNLMTVIDGDPDPNLTRKLHEKMEEEIKAQKENLKHKLLIKLEPFVHGALDGSFFICDYISDRKNHDIPSKNT